MIQTPLKNKNFLHTVFAILFSLSFLPCSFAMDEPENEEIADDIRGMKRKAEAPLSQRPKKSKRRSFEFSPQQEDSEDSKLYVIYGTKIKKNTISKPIKLEKIAADKEADDDRELLYTGIPLSKFPKIKNKAIYRKKICKDAALGHFEPFLEESSGPDQRLILGSENINGFLKSTQLMGEHNGMLVNEIDRREKVKATNSTPWSGIASLEMHYYATDGQNSYIAKYFGSGALISNKRYILTAAHNLYDKNTGYLPLSVKASPGLNDGAQYCHATSMRYYIDPEYFMDPTPKNDIAIIDFGTNFQENNPRFQNNEPFSFGIKFFPEKKLVGKMLTITGFPGGAIINNELRYLKCERMMFSHGRAITVTDGIISYDIDTTRGNSGSPVYFREEESFYCCGVHSGEGQNFTNNGAHLNKNKIKLIKQWLAK